MSLNKIKAVVANSLLNELLLESTFFNICTLEKFFKLFNIELSRADYDELRQFHCIHWNQMGADGELEFKRHVIKRIRVYLGAELDIPDGQYEVVTQRRLQS